MLACTAPEQIQDIVLGTIAAAVDTGDLVAGAPQMREMPMPEATEMTEPPMMAPEQIAPQGAMQ